ncbi:MAG: glycosyltransferase family 4 protein [Acidobacteria bacterium]|nr:glycosyltransferase family 4 protein [Acidobacteriota bacterium]
MKVLYTAAHAGAEAIVPIGGGGAIARMLEQQWRRSLPFELEIVRPQETASEIVKYTQGEYTKFCHRFRKFATNRILAEDPAQTIVLANDIGEGPDFELLERHGYRVFTIWHVDVLAFVMKMYLGEWVSPERAARAMAPFEPWLPGPLRLVFTNQHRCVRCSTGHIVMTDAMKQRILKCYPETNPAKIHVVPWGTPEAAGVGSRQPSPKPVVLTLSRISPEKGQHRLLEAARGLDVKIRIAGEAAFMGGDAYLRRLRKLSQGMDIEFPGHLSGQAKLDAFASADIYAFPSVSESYGLTLMEALSHGLPAVAWNHEGAEAILQPEFGTLVSSTSQLRAAIEQLLNDPARRQGMGAAAKAYAQARPFRDAAAKVAGLLLQRPGFVEEIRP